ncbi:PCI domain-containing protein [Sporobolomyces koalae]|uniref:PCI domain-containing protein n=1 Tax=Sporobolomyces koalae TaxID=500713 RepID=UPI00317F91B1
MAQQSSSIVFQDEFTHAHGGSCFFVAVDPNFVADVTDAAQVIARSRPEAERESFVSTLSSAAEAAQPPAPQAQEDEQEGEEPKQVQESDETREAKRNVVAQVLASLRDTTVEAADKEFEGFANLVLSFVLSAFPADHPDFSSHILALVDAIAHSTDRTANPTLSTRYATLANLFNSLPSSSASLHQLRLAVLLKLISYAAQNDDFAVIQPALNKFESYLVSWGFGPGTQGEEEGNAAVSQIVEILVRKGKLAEARTLLLSHLSSPSAVEGRSATPSSTASELASSLIALSLHLPDVYDFAALSTARFPAIANPSSNELKQLLEIFQKGDIAAFGSVKFPISVASLSLEQDSLDKKLRLIKLAELCSERVGETVQYGEIAQALDLKTEGDDGEEVETWVIDAIRASLLAGRLSQPTQSLSITRALPRSFESKHWTVIEQRLQSWRKSLDSILASTQRGLGGNASVGGTRNASNARGDESAIEVVNGQQQKEEEA